MSEEEKKAIEYLKNRYWYVDDYDTEIAVETILKLLEKQQKEIKLMKSININDNYISKDKIKNKIKELEETMKQDEVDEFGIHSIGWSVLDYVVEQLKELLEE